MVFEGHAVPAAQVGVVAAVIVPDSRALGLIGSEAGRSPRGFGKPNKRLHRLAATTCAQPERDR
jgi:hypothetical protein